MKILQKYKSLLLKLDESRKEKEKTIKLLYFHSLKRKHVKSCLHKKICKFNSMPFDEIKFEILQLEKDLIKYNGLIKMKSDIIKKKTINIKSILQQLSKLGECAN